MEREGYRFMNAGIGGDTAYNLLKRLRPIVKSQPESVVILVGTNDMQAYRSLCWERTSTRCLTGVSACSMGP